MKTIKGVYPKCRICKGKCKQENIMYLSCPHFVPLLVKKAQPKTKDQQMTVLYRLRKRQNATGQRHGQNYDFKCYGIRNTKCLENSQNLRTIK